MVWKCQQEEILSDEQKAKFDSRSCMLTFYYHVISDIICFLYQLFLRFVKVEIAISLFRQWKYFDEWKWKYWVYIVEVEVEGLIATNTDKPVLWCARHAVEIIAHIIIPVTGDDCCMHTKCALMFRFIAKSCLGIFGFHVGRKACMIFGDCNLENCLMGG